MPHIPERRSQVPPRSTARHRAPDRGMLVLEQKLSILALGPSHTRRNPALDVLTGRVPDERLQLLKASLMATRIAQSPESTDGAPLAASAAPTAMVLPVAAIRMAAVARANRRGASPWLLASAGARPRLRLVSPTP